MLFAVFSTLVPAMAADEMNCFTYVVGRKVSATGRVIVGHNEDDRDPIYVKWGIVPARDWPEGTVLPATKGCCGTIPQVPHTLSAFWGEVKFAHGDSNADFFYNERGVLVVSNSGGKTRSKEMSDDAALTDGGIRFNLRRAVGERAGSAREAVRIVCELVGRYGYQPAARIYTVADRDEAWQVSVVHGRNYVAVRCPDDKVTILPNLYTVRDLSAFPPEDVIVSPGLKENARQKGYWDGTSPFDFANAYQGSADYGARHLFEHPNNTGRFRLAIRDLTGKDWGTEPYPFALPPRGKISAADMKRLLSSHDANGAVKHSKKDWSICRPTTIESLVCEFGENLAETTLHLAKGRPCETPFRAIVPFGPQGIPPDVDDSLTAAARLATHVAETDSWQSVCCCRDYRDLAGRAKPLAGRTRLCSHFGH